VTVFTYILRTAGSHNAERRLTEQDTTLLQRMQTDNIKFREAEEMRNVLNVLAC